MNIEQGNAERRSVRAWRRRLRADEERPELHGVQMNCPMIMPCIEHAPLCDACKSGASAPIPTPRLVPRDWYANHGELCAFVRACIADNPVGGDDVLEMFESPWKFTEEYQAWRALDRPASFDASSKRAAETGSVEK